MKNQEEVGGEGGAKALGQKRAWCVREPAGGPDSGSVRRGRENQVQLKKRRGGGGWAAWDHCKVISDRQQRRGAAQTMLTNAKRKANSKTTPWCDVSCVNHSTLL